MPKVGHLVAAIPAEHPDFSETAMAIVGPNINPILSGTPLKIDAQLTEFSQNLKQAAPADPAPAKEVGLFSPGELRDKPYESVTRLSATSQQYFEQRNVDFALDLTTLQGDRVSVRLTQDAAVALNTSSIQSGELRFGEDIQVFVEGDLDVQEQASVEGLVSRVFDVADEFFAGEQTNVLNQVLQSGFDAPELASYALDLSLSQRLEQTTTYAAVGGEVGGANLLEKNAGLQQRGLTGLLEALSEQQQALVEEARALFADPGAVQLIRDTYPLAVGVAVDTRVG